MMKKPEKEKGKKQKQLREETMRFWGTKKIQREYRTGPIFSTIKERQPLALQVRSLLISDLMSREKSVFSTELNNSLESKNNSQTYWRARDRS